MKRNPIFIIIGALIGLNILAWGTVWDLSQVQKLEVTFFDVGEGDAIFIETPSPGRHQILIDGGPDDRVLKKLGLEMPFWDRTIDLVILTHPDHDHIAGILEVLKRYKIENIVWTGVIKKTSEYQEWLELIKEEGAEIFIAHSGQRIGEDKIVFDLLYPFESLEGKEVENINNTSIVLRLVFSKSSFLFPGDIYKSIEKELVEKGIEINSDVLKVSHHGSKTSSASEFITAVSPRFAVISVGKNNKYRHPHQEVLDNLIGIKILRTDLEGDIKILTDGTNYKIK